MSNVILDHLLFSQYMGRYGYYKVYDPETKKEVPCEGTLVEHNAREGYLSFRTNDGQYWNIVYETISNVQTKDNKVFITFDISLQALIIDLNKKPPAEPVVITDDDMRRFGLTP